MITFNIASIPSRKEQLIKTIDSIINQVDLVRVALNGYTDSDMDWLEDNYKFEKLIIYVRTDNGLGDAYKFWWVDQTNGYYFTGDDDLIYPPTYIEDTIKMVDKFGIVSYHGRTFSEYPIDNYHKPSKPPALRIRCLGAWEFNEPVDIGGSGVMAFHTDNFRPPFEIFETANKADVYISCYAKKMGKTIWGLKHSADYFTYQQVPTTIYDERVNDCALETKLVNQYFA